MNESFNFNTYLYNVQIEELISMLLMLLPVYSSAADSEQRWAVCKEDKFSENSVPSSCQADITL